MTPPSDDLGNLWHSVPATGKADPRALLDELGRRDQKFTRTIRRRDWRESAAGVLVCLMFLYFGLRAHAPLDRLSDFWLSAYGAWVIYYLRRYSKVSGEPDPAQPLDGFRRQIVDRYDRQIRLLQTARYWYILPLWVGLMIGAVSFLERTGSRSGFLVMAAAWAAVAAVLVWVNEVPGVRYVRKQRQQVVDLFQSEGENR